MLQNLSNWPHSFLFFKKKHDEKKINKTEIYFKPCTGFHIYLFFRRQQREEKSRCNKAKAVWRLLLGWVCGKSLLARIQIHLG